MSSAFKIKASVLSVTDDYVLYEVPFLIKGKPYNLTVAYDFGTETYRMLTARPDEEGVPPGRGERLLVEGDPSALSAAVCLLPDTIIGTARPSATTTVKYAEVPVLLLVSFSFATPFAFVVTAVPEALTVSGLSDSSVYSPNDSFFRKRFSASSSLTVILDVISTGF